MKLSGLLLMMSLLGSNAAVTFHQDGAVVPAVLEEEVGGGAVGCEMPPACGLSGYEGWHTMGSRCVKHFYSPLNFTDAEMMCRRTAPGGHLLSVHSAQDHASLQCFLKHSAYPPKTWLGGFELFQSGRYVWTDGSTWNYNNWYPGEPTSTWTSWEDCVEMNFRSVGKWNDIPCNLERTYVCSTGI